MNPPINNDYHPAIINDPFVQDLMEMFSASVVPGSVKMIEHAMEMEEESAATVAAYPASALPQAPAQHLFAAPAFNPAIETAPAATTVSTPITEPATQPEVAPQPVRRHRRSF